jgi:predicted phage terminase large subunit-like protein
MTPDYAAILRRDLMSFIERSFYELNPQTKLLRAPHLELIAAKLEACRRGKINRLIVNLPPRQLKSQCASVAFPAWYLAHHPAAHIICASYGQDLADKFARDCRRVMTSAWYRRLFPVRLADRQAVHDFATTEQGTRMATSVGGVLTGRGADMIIIDDPLKPDEALSESRRNAVNEWYDHTLLTRLNDKERGCIVIIMQRLHQDDLVGHVIEQEDWEILSFAAIAEADEIYQIDSPLGRRLFKREAGSILHPERESAVTLAHIRQTIGEYNFSAQYQQNPTPVGGAMVKTGWLQYYEPDERPERFSQTVQSWDTANKATELSDYSVCTTWGAHDNRYYLLDVFRQRLNYPDLKRKVQELAKRDRPSSILIEDKASGTQLIQDLKADRVYAITAYQPPAGTDKIMRLHAQTAVFENGRVLVPSRAPWLSEYINELTSFPGARHDDQVDSTTQALDHLRTSEGRYWFKNITPELLARARTPRYPYDRLW